MVAYLLNDIIRAVDPSPGLGATLKNLREIRRQLQPPPRKRVAQPRKIKALFPLS